MLDKNYTYLEVYIIWVSLLLKCNLGLKSFVRLEIIDSCIICKFNTTNQTIEFKWNKTGQMHARPHIDLGAVFITNDTWI